MTDIAEPELNKPKQARWGQDRRLEFIDFRLLWEGRINRSDLTEFFGISIPQASLDLTRYQELAGTNIEYDKSEKVYLATLNFTPAFTSGDSQHYLNQLLAINSGMMSRETSFLGWHPDFAAVLSPARTLERSALFDVLRAIRTKSRIEIYYQSFTSDAAKTRYISPHAIAYDGFRWHARAYCHEHNDFRDFVFARMLRIGAQSASNADATQDAEWHNLVDVIIGPNPSLSPGKRRAIELDYAMHNGQVRVKCKQSLLLYLLRRLRLDDTNPPQDTQHIVLINRDELTQYLPARDQQASKNPAT